MQASIELLEADQSGFEARCHRTLDADGTRLIDELCAEMEVVGWQMKLLVDDAGLTNRYRALDGDAGVNAPIGSCSPC